MTACLENNAINWDQKHLETDTLMQSYETINFVRSKSLIKNHHSTEQECWNIMGDLGSDWRPKDLRKLRTPYNQLTLK